MKLRERREALGLTQEQVAKRAGLHQGAVSALERGAIPNPSIDRAKKVAEALDWTVDEFIAAVRETSEAA